MRLRMVMIAAGLLVGSAGSGVAAVNCKQVNKYLQLGRSVKDVAETMVISEDEVKKCQQEGAATKPEEGKAAPAEGH